MRRRPSCRHLSHLLLSCLLASTAAGCDPNPTADEAQSYLSQHRSTVDAVRRSLLTRISAESALTAPVCTEPDCGGPTAEERGAAVRTLRDQMLDVFDHPHVLGLRVRRGEDGSTLLALGLTRPGHANGRVRVDDGREFGDERLGWGAWQTSFERGGIHAGDGEMREGIEVRWQESIAEAPYTMTLILLGEHETTPAWRDAIRRRDRAR